MKKLLINWLLNPLKVLLYSATMLAVVAIGIIVLPFLLVVGLILFVIGTSVMEVYGKTWKSYDHF